MKKQISRRLISVTLAAALLMTAVFGDAAIKYTVGAESRKKTWDFENSDVSVAMNGLSTYLRNFDAADTLRQVENTEAWEIRSDKEWYYRGSDSYAINTGRANKSSFGYLLADEMYTDFEMSVVSLGGCFAGDNAPPLMMFGVGDPTVFHTAEKNGYGLYFDNFTGKVRMESYHISGSNNMLELSKQSAENWASKSSFKYASNTLFRYNLKVSKGVMTLSLEGLFDNTISTAVTYQLPDDYAGGYVGVCFPSSADTSWAYGHIYNISVTDLSDPQTEAWHFDSGSVGDATDELVTYLSDGNAGYKKENNSECWSRYDGDGGYIVSKSDICRADAGNLLSALNYRDFELTVKMRGGYFDYAEQYGGIVFGVTDPTKHITNSAAAGYKVTFLQETPQIILSHNGISSVEGYRKVLSQGAPDGWNQKYTSAKDNVFVYTLSVSSGKMTYTLASEDGKITQTAEYLLPDTYEGGKIGVNFLSGSETYGQIYDIKIVNLSAKTYLMRKVKKVPDIHLYHGIYRSADELHLPETVTASDRAGNLFTMNVAWNFDALADNGEVLLQNGSSRTVTGKLLTTVQKNKTVADANDLTVSVKLYADAELSWDFDKEISEGGMDGLSTFVRRTDDAMVPGDNSAEWEWANDGKTAGKDKTYIISKKKADTDDYGALISERSAYSFETELTASGGTVKTKNAYPKILFGLKDAGAYYGSNADGGYALYYKNETGKLMLEYRQGGQKRSVALNDKALSGFGKETENAANVTLCYNITVKNGKGKISVKSTDGKGISGSAEFSLPESYEGGFIGVCYPSCADSDTVTGQIYSLKIKNNDPVSTEIVSATAPADCEIPTGEYSSTEQMNLPQTVEAKDKEGNIYRVRVAWSGGDLFNGGALKLASQQKIILSGTLVNGKGISGILFESKNIAVKINVIGCLAYSWDFTQDTVAAATENLITYKRDTATDIYEKSSVTDDFSIGRDEHGKYLISTLEKDRSDVGYLLYQNPETVNFRLTATVRGGFAGGTGIFPSVVFGVRDPSAYYQKSEDAGYGVFVHNTNGGRVCLNHYHISGSENSAVIQEKSPDTWDAPGQYFYYYPSNVMFIYTVEVSSGILNFTAETPDGKVHTSAEYVLPEDYQGGYVGISYAAQSGSYDLCQIYNMKVEPLPLPAAHKAVSVNTIGDISLAAGEYKNASELGLPKTVSVQDDSGVSRRMNVIWDTADLFKNGALVLETSDHITVNGKLTGTYQSDGVFVTDEGLTAQIVLKVENVLSWDFEQTNIADATQGLSTYVRNTDSDRFVLADNASEWTHKTGDDSYIVSSANADRTDYGYLVYTGSKFRDFELEVKMKGAYFGGGSVYPTIVFGMQSPNYYYRNSSKAGYHLFVNTSDYCRFMLGKYYIDNNPGHVKRFDRPADGAPAFSYSSNMTFTYRIKVSGNSAVFSIESTDGKISNTCEYTLPSDYEAGYLGVMYCSVNNNTPWDYGQIYSMKISSPYTGVTDIQPSEAAVGVNSGTYGTLAEMNIDNRLAVNTEDGTLCDVDVVWDAQDFFNGKTVSFADGDTKTLQGTLKNTVSDEGKLIVTKSKKISVTVRGYGGCTVTPPAPIYADAGVSAEELQLPKTVAVNYGGKEHQAAAEWNYNTADLNTEGAYTVTGHVRTAVIDGVTVFVDLSTDVSVNIKGTKESVTFSLNNSGEMNAFLPLVNRMASSKLAVLEPAELSRCYKVGNTGLTFKADSELKNAAGNSYANLTTQLSRLVYTERAYRNFEASVEVKCDSGYYPRLEFGLRDITRANGRIIAGYSVYTENDEQGRAILTGSDGNETLYAAAENASAEWKGINADWYTISIRVKNNTAACKIISNGKTVSELTYRLGAGYEGGYLALANGIGGVVYRNFRIVDLEDAENRISYAVSAETYEEITVNAGLAVEQLLLPKTASVTMNDGSNADLPIKWFVSDIARGSLYSAGTREISGVILTDTVSEQTVFAGIPVKQSINVKGKCESVRLNFTDRTQMKNFDCYYSANGMPTDSTLTKQTGYSGQWAVQGGRLKRLAGTASPGSDDVAETVALASAVYNKKQYKNFELNIDITADDSKRYMPFVGFAISDPAAFPFAEGSKGGMTAYISADGELCFRAGENVLHTVSLMTESNFDPYAKHHLRLVVSDGVAELYLDWFTEPYRIKLPDEYANGGYIALMSGLNAASFDNFTLTELSSDAENAEKWTSVYPYNDKDMFD